MTLTSEFIGRLALHQTFEKFIVGSSIFDPTDVEGCLGCVAAFIYLSVEDDLSHFNSTLFS